MLFWREGCYPAMNSRKALLGKESWKMEVHVQGKKLYVGNLNYSATKEEVTELFSTYGQVLSVNIIEDRGFGFVEMSTQEEAEGAKAALNETEFKGRTLRVDEARPPRDRRDDDYKRRDQRQRRGGPRKY